jgi:hypothetical protein
MASTKLPKVPRGLGPKGHGHADKHAPPLPPIRGPHKGDNVLPAKPRGGKSGKK